MKEALVRDEATLNDTLDMLAAHKVHVLYGGTRILQQVHASGSRAHFSMIFLL